MSKYSAASTHSSASKQSAGSNQSAPFKNDDKKSSNPLSNKKEIKIDEHLQDINEVVAKYNTNLKNGLTATQAQNLLKANGPNQLTPPKKVPEWLKFVKQLSGGFSLLLWFGAFLCIIVYVIDVCRKPEPSKDNLYLGIVLILVVLLTGAFAYYQEAKSSKIMDSFKDLIPRKAFVLRDGNIKEIDPKILVVGDVVEISSGDQVPADILIFESFGCKVDNSSLTGESEPQARTPLCTHNNPMETENIAFFSTYCTEGKARGIVIRVGDYTAIGQIAFLTTGLDDAETSIAREIRLFIKYITIFACSLGFVFFVVSMIIGNSWLDAMIFFIGIIVANVPEGLMATVTVSLSLTAKSMAKKNCLVKNLQAVETLGSTSIICSDKTGTLTQNKMRVSHIWFDNEIIEINCQLKDIPKHKIIKSTYLNKENMFEDFLRVCTLCSKTKFKPDQEKVPIYKRECSGDASETALFKFVACVGVNTDQIRTKFPISAEIPFNSTNKFHLTVHTLKDENVKHKYLVCIKGAPERVLKLCSAILIAGKSRLFDSHSTKAMEKIFEHLASMGERVLGFAEMYTNDIDSLFEDESRTKVNMSNVSNFTLLGLMSLIDPARPEVPEAVSKCRLAGIQVFMVTGDHPITARAIAETVGIISKPKEDIIVFDSGIFENLKKLKAKDKSPLNGKAIVVPGDMLSQLSNSQLDYIVRNASEIVFARTSPEQKLFIVQSCQRLGHIVAATGDGVNDSPALKSANIGIAMGITGSDVSKQAADMILMDDNFASIVFGIEEGRVIFDNLKKSIAYTLASNFAEIMPFLVYVTMGFPLALGTITILCIDLGTDIIPAISLAYEKAEEDIMKQKPRHRDDHLVTRRMFNRAYFQIGMVQASAGFMTYFIVMADHGFFINDLFGLREAWDSEQYLMYNRFGELYSFKDRKILEHVCQTAYFSAIVMCQVADLIICKTRRNSIMKQGMRNTILTWSLFIEISLALFLIYCPGMKSILNVYPLKWWYWCIAMPFSIFIFLYDETRRMILRLRPHGFFQKATYF